MFGKGNNVDQVAHFCGITGVSTKDAKKYLDKYRTVEAALNAYYDNPNAFATSSAPPSSAPPSTSKLNQLFWQYKDPNSEDIAVNGTIQFCADLDVDPEDVVLLAVAFELKSRRLAEWNKQGWTEGWKSLGCDNIPAMKNILPQLRDKLSLDPDYFKKVYNHTFALGLSDGQRSLAVESAQAFWAILLPHGLQGRALAHIKINDGEDVSMEEGWKIEYNDWWFDYLNDAKLKGISKDTWNMFYDFVRSINSTFENYNEEEAWPSTIDSFVHYAKERFKK